MLKRRSASIMLTAILLVMHNYVASAATRDLLLTTAETSYTFDPEAISRENSGHVTVRVFGESGAADRSDVLYELSCPEQTFSQLEVLELVNGETNRCSNRSEPIRIKPEKHLVPAALWDRLCR